MSLQTDLGKTKRRGLIFPTGMTFGKPNEPPDGGTSEALYGWPSLKKIIIPGKYHEKPAQRDFMALNKAAVLAGLVTANEHYKFRATHDIRCKTENGDSQFHTRRLPPNFVYGLAMRLNHLYRHSEG